MELRARRCGRIGPDSAAPPLSEGEAFPWSFYISQICLGVSARRISTNQNVALSLGSPSHRLRRIEQDWDSQSGALKIKTLAASPRRAQPPVVPE
jgi:hypothetical protein